MMGINHVLHAYVDTAQLESTPGVKSEGGLCVTVTPGTYTAAVGSLRSFSGRSSLSDADST